MRVPFKWLNDFVDLSGLSAQEVADRLQAVGVAVENVENRNPQGISGVVVGHIVEITPHPNADRLRVTRVDVGQGEPLQVVTGAPNVQQGMKVPVAIVGARLNGGLAIKKSKLRGVDSDGMMCSADELALVIKDLPADQREGVLVFPDDTPVGADVLELMSIDEHVLILEPFANRPDYLGLVGVAREAAAALDRPLKPLDLDFTEIDPPASTGAEVEVADTTLCPRYTARLLEGVQVGQTPLWMAFRLHAAGVRSVNNAVDITNYVMLEVGQPLHAFDRDRLKGAASQPDRSHIEVRRARADETMVSIDGVERRLDPEMLVIADAGRPVAIAGVMGGLDSEVSAETHRVLLESAIFQPASVRRTSARLGLRSESSRRFEKGLDYQGADLASRRACHWYSKLCGAKVSRGVVDAGGPPPAEVTVRMRPSRVNRVLGSQLPSDQMASLLQSLGFGVARPEDTVETLEVRVPSFRPDVRREEDLAEEIARHYGYDNIPSTLPTGRSSAGRSHAGDVAEERIRTLLVGMGLYEAVTLSLLHPSEYEKLGMKGGAAVRVRNPLVADQSELRTSLLPHLCQVAVHNRRARATQVRVFELSKIYRPRALETGGQGDGRLPEPEELRRLSFVLAGAPGPAAPDFFTLKGIIEELLSRLGMPARWLALKGAEPAAFADQVGAFHPGKAAVLQIGDRAAGLVGSLHPRTIEALDLDGEVVAAELDLDVLIRQVSSGPVAYVPISRFPEVERDLALVLDEDLPSARVEEVVRGAGGASLVRLRCFDVYHGSQIPQGKKSLAWSLWFQSRERTLTDTEIDTAMKSIIGEVEKVLGGKVRS